MVAAAAGSPSGEAKQALEQLCQAYWPPLYWYLRRSGHNSEDARDAVQEFFCEMIQENRFSVADHQRGRFRNFLLAALKNFVSNQQRKENAIKRGGNANIIQIDSALAESMYVQTIVDNQTPDELFQKQWALTVIEKSIESLQNEYQRDGKQDLFEKLKQFINSDDTKDSYQKVADQLNMSTVAVKVAVHRMRKRCQKWIRHEIAQTVNDESEIDAEIDALFEVLG